MYVAKRDGRKEPVMFDKITARVKKMCYGLNKIVDPVKVAMRVIEGLYDGVTTSELDNLAAETAATMTTAHPDYARLAARIAVSNLHKNTKKSFSETMDELYTYVNPRTGKKSPLLADDVYKIINENKDKRIKYPNETSVIISFSGLDEDEMVDVGLDNSGLFRFQPPPLFGHDARNVQSLSEIRST